MITAKRFTLAILATAAVALPLVGAGVAAAAEDDTSGGYPSTQKPDQVISFLRETFIEQMEGWMDALNGDDRPDGANGIETEFPPPDPRYIEGPVGGLLNGPRE